MNPISVILLVSVLANLTLAGFVLWRRHTRAVHFAFAALVSIMALWNCTNFLISLTNDLAYVVPVGRVAFLLAVFLLNAFLIFTWLFPETYHPQPRRWAVLAVLALIPVGAVVGGSTLVQADVLLTDTGKQPVFGPLYWAYVGYLLCLFGWGTLNLLRSRWQAPPGRGQLQLNYSLSGFVLSFLAIAGAQFVLPLWMPPSEYYLLGSASTLCWTSFTFYAIFRHRLMDIGIAFRNLLIKVALASLVSLLVLVPFLVNRYLATETPVLTEVILILIITILLTAYLPEIQRRITHFVDQRLFRGRYDHEHALMRFGDELQRTYGRESIARLIAHEIPIVMQAEGCSVYLPNEIGTDFSLFAHAGGAASPAGGLPDAIKGTDPILIPLVKHSRRLVKEDLAYAQSPWERAPEILARLEALGATVAAPMVCQGQIQGLMFLGDKHQDNVYTSDDLELLRALASQAAIALSNTRLYEEVLVAKKLYETILRHMQRGVLAVNNRLEVVTLNDTGVSVLKLRDQSYLGRPISELVPEFTQLLRRTLEQEEGQSVKEISLDRSGRAIPCECETSVMADVRNRVTGAMVVFQDLTERKRLAEQVRRMDRLASVGTLAAGLAHEIKNPLVSIQTFAQLLPERYADAKFREGFGEVVCGEINRINKLVQNLLEFARPRPRLTGPVCLQDLVDRSLTLLESELRKEQISVVRNYEPNLPIIPGDSEKLYQVIFNLLQNAIQAFEQPPRNVTIATRSTTLGKAPATRPAVLLEIEDTGKGIDEADLPHIFDPFFSTKNYGSGLGLSICHSILEEHKAHIEVHSVLGKGTTFSIVLPVQDERTEAFAPRVR